jgi:hypothetical protein
MAVKNEDIKRIRATTKTILEATGMKEGQWALVENTDTTNILQWAFRDYVGNYSYHDVDSPTSIGATFSDGVQLQEAINNGSTVFLPQGNVGPIGDIVFTAGKSYVFLSSSGASDDSKVAFQSGTMSVTGGGSTEVVFEGSLSFDTAYTISGISTVYFSAPITSADSATLTLDSGVTSAYANIVSELTISSSNAFTYEELRDSASVGASDVQSFWKTPRDQTKKDHVLGYVNPDGIVTSFDTPTRTHTVTHTSGIVKLWSEGNYLEIPNGDARLSYQLPDLNQLNYLKHDSTGQLVGSAGIIWENVRTRCLGSIVGWDKDAGIEILTICRRANFEANEVEQYASYRSKGIQPTDDRLLMDGVVGDDQTGHGDAAYFTARDYEFAISAVSATAIAWPIFYYEGTDDSAKNRIKRFVSLPTLANPFIRGTDIGLGSSNLIYNSFPGGVPTVNTASNNNYVIGHIAVGDGQNPVVALTPQGVYGSVSAAQNAIEDEVNNLTLSSELFHDVAIVASFICKGDTGAFQDADGNGNAFVAPPLGVSGGGVGTTTQKLESVLAAGNDANGFDIVGVGDIGIGTDSPDVEMHVHGGVDSISSVKLTNDSTGLGTAAGLDVRYNTSTGGELYLHENQPLNLASNATIGLVLDENQVVTAPEMTIAEIDSASSDVLVTKDYVQRGAFAPVAWTTGTIQLGNITGKWRITGKATFTDSVGSSGISIGATTADIHFTSKIGATASDLVNSGVGAIGDTIDLEIYHYAGENDWSIRGVAGSPSAVWEYNSMHNAGSSDPVFSFINLSSADLIVQRVV